MFSPSATSISRVLLGILMGASDPPEHALIFSAAPTGFHKNRPRSLEAFLAGPLSWENARLASLPLASTLE